MDSSVKNAVIIYIKHQKKNLYKELYKYLEIYISPKEITEILYEIVHTNK
jgi:hypothetical protein